MPVNFNEPPRHTILQASQDKQILDSPDGMTTVGWTLRITMMAQGILHTKVIPYTCEPGEITLTNTEDERVMLEQILQKLEVRDNIFGVCADELDAKIATAN